MPVSFLLAVAAVVGVTDNPCPALPPMPAEMQTWRRAVAEARGQTPPPLPSAAAAYVAAYQEARRGDWADLCRYRADDLRLRGQHAAARDVVFMGDSITEGWASANPAFYIRGRINRGISGQTTQQMLIRFPQDVIALHPRTVHIMAGTNDLAGNTGPTTYDAIEGNVAAMVVLARAAGIRVVLAATPPSAVFSWRPGMMPAPQIAELNRRLKALAAREKVSFLDYGTVLATPEGALKPEFTADGTHPNAAGYAAMEPLVEWALKR